MIEAINTSIKSEENIIEPSVLLKLNSAIKELTESKNIVENSTHFMQFTVQETLDSALLKAGKFKKHQSKFNISQTVQKVIDM